MKLTMKYTIVHQKMSAVLKTTSLIQAPVTHCKKIFCSASKIITLQNEMEYMFRQEKNNSN